MSEEATTDGAKPEEHLSCDIAIVGAGAAGLAAGIFAAEEAARLAAVGGSKRRILLLDGAKQIGAKILISGGGRCNVTNVEAHPRDFCGNPPFVRNVLAAFGVDATIAWFESMGVGLVREETGKLFPKRGGAKGILEALTRRCTEAGAEIRTGHRVRELSAHPAGGAAVDGPGGETGDREDRAGSESGDAVSDREEPAGNEPGATRHPPAGFLLRHERGSVLAERVILATGGRSIPKSGSDGEGWEIARGLGHSVSATHPALVPLLLDPRLFHATLSGLSQPVELTTVANGKRVDRRAGSLLWTHFGISGPVVLDASRHWIAAREGDPKAELRGNFIPEWDAEKLEKWLLLRIGSTPRRSVLRVLADLLPEKFVRSYLGASGADPATAIGELRRDERRRLGAGLVDFSFPVIGDRGWNFAEVTAGGIPLSEVDYRTMGSRKAPGLFVVGEMLDCDGRIGGFNFQWAWATGYLAGIAAARSGSNGAVPLGARHPAPPSGP